MDDGVNVQTEKEKTCGWGHTFSVRNLSVFGVKVKVAFTFHEN
jgi:hypothetical protein